MKPDSIAATASTPHRPHPPPKIIKLGLVSGVGGPQGRVPYILFEHGTERVAPDQGEIKHDSRLLHFRQKAGVAGQKPIFGPKTRRFRPRKPAILDYFFPGWGGYDPLGPGNPIPDPPPTTPWNPDLK